MAQCSVVWRRKSRYCEHQNFNRIIFFKRDLNIEFNSILVLQCAGRSGLSLYMGLNRCARAGQGEGEVRGEVRASARAGQGLGEVRGE